FNWRGLMLSIIGLITILIILAMLLRGKVIPGISLVVIQVIAAFVTGVSIYALADLFDVGIDHVIDIDIMFIFAILYFGIMQSAGLFDPLIQRMIRITHGNIIVISIVTVLIAAVAQLDGSGASTFLITIPALLPLYQR